MPYVHPDDYADTFHNATAEQEREDDLGARIDRLGATALRLKSDREVLLRALQAIADESVFNQQRFAEDTDTDYFLRCFKAVKDRARAAIAKATALEQSIAAINGEKGI